MIKKLIILFLTTCFLANVCVLTICSKEEVKLPPARLVGKMSVEEALASRRSRRIFKDHPLNIEHVSQLLWAAQGITGQDSEHRTAPSAAKVYPSEIYLIVGDNKVSDLEAGLYRYNPIQHSLSIILKEDLRKEISRACYDENQIEKAPVCLIIVIDFSRLIERYGEQRRHYATIFGYMEAGHIAQNIYLQAESLGLGTVSMGGIKEDDVSQILCLPENYIPIYVMPVGFY